MTTIFDFINALQYPWMQRALIAAILIGIISAVIGVFIILRGVIFLGEAIAHSAFAGAALAILLGFADPLYLILVFGLSTSVGVNYINEKKIMKDEVVIGVAFTFFMALAIFFIGLMDRYSTTVQAILFGRILLITRQNYFLLIIFSIVVLGLILFFKKELYFMTFDNDLAVASGVPVTKLSYLFLVMVALVIDVSITAIGAILVFAMLITPAATAYQLTYNIDRLLVLAAVFGVISSVGGLMLAYILDWPSGATIVLLATSMFIVSFVLSPKRRRLVEGKTDSDRIPHFHPEDTDSEQYKLHLLETSKVSNKGIDPIMEDE